MAKRSIVTLFVCLFVTHTGLAQNVAATVPSSVSTVGKNIATGQDIPARTYHFSKRIYATELVDSCRLFFHLRNFKANGKYPENAGNLVMYDLSEDKLLWSRSLNRTDRISICNDGILIDGNRMRFLDKLTGTERWGKNRMVYHVVNEKGLILACKAGMESMEGIDMATGRRLWRRPLSREYGWNGVFPFNDSTLLVSAGGISAVNYRTGAGWDYRTPTGNKDYTKSVVMNLLGITSLILTGTGFIYTGYSLQGNICSNIAIDSTSIYMAAKDEIFCLAHNGWKKWFNLFPEKRASSSEIFLSDSLLWVINYGMTLDGEKTGVPFVTALHRKDGWPMVCHINDEKDDPVLDFDVRNGFLFILYAKKLQQYDMQAGRLINEKNLNLLNGEKCLEFGRGSMLVYRDSVFSNLASEKDPSLYLSTTSGVLVCDFKGNITDQRFPGDVYTEICGNNTCKIITNGERSFLIDATAGKKTAELFPDIKSSFLSGDTFYIPDNKTMYVLNLNSLSVN
jgi:hypothetical protein